MGAIGEPLQLPVCARDDGFRYRQPKRLCRLEVQNEVKFSGLPDWQFSWISSFKDIPGLNIKPGEYSTRCGPKDHSPHRKRR
jgi:hypothetical protein